MKMQNMTVSNTVVHHQGVTEVVWLNLSRKLNICDIRKEEQLIQVM